MFCWYLTQYFLPGTCVPHHQRCMKKVVTFLLIKSLLIIKGCSVPILSSAGGPAGATSSACSLQTAFSQPPLFMLLCSSLIFHRNQAFPGLSWDQEGCLTWRTGHAADCRRQLLIGHVCIQCFIHASHNYQQDGAAWFLSDWNNN